MDFGALPPEINSARIYSGPGSAPMLAAATAWDALANELHSTATGYGSVVADLASSAWHGPSSAAMAAAAAPYEQWMRATAAQAEQAALQARAAAGAYELAFSATVPPPVVAANRALLMSLVATNFLGQNTPAIAATEAQYAEMWAQDAAAMYGYAGASAAAATVPALSAPPETANPAGTAGQAGAVAQATGTATTSGVQSTLSQVVSSVPNSLQGLASPLSSASVGVNPFAPGSNTATTGIAGLLNLLDGQTGSSIGSFLTSGLSNGILSGNWFNPASLSPAVTSAFGDIGFLAVAGQGASGFNPALFSAATAPAAVSTVGLGHVGSVVGSVGSSGFGGSAVSAGVGRATLVGTMSAPPSWTAAIPAASPSPTALPPGWSIAPGAGLEEVSATQGVPGMPGMPMGAGAPRGYGFAAPRYGFRPTVVAHPPAAG
jgi:PPE-repeat protein